MCLRSWSLLILTLDFTFFAIFVFFVYSSRSSISFETVKAIFPQKKTKNQQQQLHKRSKHGAAMLQVWKDANDTTSVWERGCDDVLLFTSPLVREFFVKFFFETITNYTEFWKPQPLKNCRSLAVFIMSSTSGPFQFHTRWLRRSKYWLKNESTIDHIVHVKLTSFSLKMKAVFSQGCVFQRCVFSKVCFSKGVFLKGVLLSKGVFWNTPFWLKVCFLIKGVFTEHIFPQHISWMVC